VIQDEGRLGALARQRDGRRQLVMREAQVAAQPILGQQVYTLDEARPQAKRGVGLRLDVASDATWRAWLTETQMPLLPWSSQAHGFFTGRARPDDRSDEELARCWYSDDNFQRLERVNELARRRGVLPINIALAYVLCQPFPTFPLIGPRALSGYCWRIHRSGHNDRISAGPPPCSRVAYSPTGVVIRISAGLPEFANSIYLRRAPRCRRWPSN